MLIFVLFTVVAKQSKGEYLKSVGKWIIHKHVKRIQLPHKRYKTIPANEAKSKTRLEGVEGIFSFISPSGLALWLRNHNCLLSVVIPPSSLGTVGNTVLPKSTSPHVVNGPCVQPSACVSPRQCVFLINFSAAPGEVASRTGGQVIALALHLREMLLSRSPVLMMTGWKSGPSAPFANFAENLCHVCSW